MKDLNYLNSYRVPLDGQMGDKNNGAFRLQLKNSNLIFTVIASDGDGWDHVSVSTTERCPRWTEMQEIKEMFFGDTEAVIQIHPPQADYINNHPYCLHLWRPHKGKIPMPPVYMV